MGPNSASKLLLSLVLCAPFHSYAQGPVEKSEKPGTLAAAQTTQGNKESQAQQPKKRPKLSGVGFSSTQFTDGFRTLTASLNFVEYPISSLWLVGGHKYDWQSQKHGFDAGFKYLQGNNLLRGTLLVDNYDFGTAEGDIAAGIDFDRYLFAYKKLAFSALGDVNALSNGKQLDLGAGFKAVAGKNTALFLYSSRGPENKSSYRIADIYKDENTLAALQLDIKDRKGTVTGYLSFPYHRFIASYSGNSGKFSTISIITKGNKPLPLYARQGFLETHIIATARGESVPDSDYAPFYPAIFFLEPQGRVGTVLRANTSYNTRTGKIDSALVHNAIMLRTKKGDIVLTQKFDYDGKNSYIGAGGGYKLGRIFPAVTFQTGEKNRITADVSFSW